MTNVIQATHFSLSGRKVPQEGAQSAAARRGWPMYTATIFNADDSVLDTRSGFNDFALEEWIRSFGFRTSDFTGDPDVVCLCDHYADEHNDEQPHECLQMTLGGRARCSCGSFKANA